MKIILKSKSIIKINKNKALRNSFSMNIDSIKKNLDFKPQSFTESLKIFLNEK
jgi:hypothetical protein